MLRERSRLQHQKDQQIIGHLISDSDSESCVHQYDVLGHKKKTNCVLNAPGVFVGFSPKASESDSVRSPTSPLDFRLFSNLVNPFRSPRLAPEPEGHHKSWNCRKVGLRIIDSLDDDAPPSGKILRSWDGRNILLAPHWSIRMPNFQTRIDSSGAPKSLPKNYGVSGRPRVKPPNLQMGDSDVLSGIRETPFEPEPFEKVLSCSLDSARSWSLVTTSTNHSSSSTNSSSGNFGPGNGRNPENSSATKLNPASISISSAQCFTGSLSASEIELSEDYTCVKTYGPYPKTTHIFGDCIFECHDSTITGSPKKLKTATECPAFYPAGDFMSCCYSCKKRLEGEDIYIYRGEKAFCSESCRSQEILMEEEKKGMDVSSSPRNSDKEKSESSSMFFVT
ncbi:FCS-Like Zinc finger 10-like [Diospyros lotus]|uniref:FCS-Like Zinc finger 10-like n=1 Tax=Diospyros lotus TaxID=55363 RepID=UPI002253A381|nr:FCS-Like Zinc finger 10-like [Diospyros lotus]XP_052202743.1 FCS-Like Zinc finger 10-like [Diospyros lotus]